MGMIGSILGTLFGSGGNVIRDTVEVFRPNAEKSAERDARFAEASLAQFAAEFGIERKGWFDRLIDGMNRLPRPLMALGTLGLISSAMYDPVWFAARMQGLVLVPEPLWWLLGAIVTFYFGGRHQAKTQSFQKSLAQTTARTKAVIENLDALEKLNADRPPESDTPAVADTGPDVALEEKVLTSSSNPALDLWIEDAKRKANVN